MPGIPDRWQAYTAMGQVIAGTKLICFKVPLKQALNNNLTQQDRFSPTILLEQCPELGLVVDLTNTTRYYNKSEFLNKGVHYKKIFCPGRVIPPPQLLSQFIKNVDDFLSQTQDKLIGVHCTHGVNRTGYFVCSYMIRRLGMTPQDAITEFERARGHRIERALYLEELLFRSEGELPPPAVEEEQEGVAENEVKKHHPGKKWRHRNRNHFTRQPGDISHHPLPPNGAFDVPRPTEMNCSYVGPKSYGSHPKQSRNGPDWQNCSNGRHRYMSHFPVSKRPPVNGGTFLGHQSGPSVNSSSSSVPNRNSIEHHSPLNDAYIDQVSFNRYGNRNGSINNHRLPLNGTYGPDRVRNPRSTEISAYCSHPNRKRDKNSGRL